MVELAFKCVDLDYKNHVVTDDQMLRPAEVDSLVGDASKAKEVLGWEPVTSFERLIEMMVLSDMKLVEQQIKPGTADVPVHTFY